MKIYIAGPMKGMPNYDHFHEAEKFCTGKGWVVFNPASLPKTDEMTPAQYMDIDLAMVRSCDAIYMLDGWKNSLGALVEYHYANFLGLKIIFQQ